MSKNQKEFNYWFTWAQFYLKSNMGSLLPGIAHNLQNTVHSFSMQLELWDRRLESNKLGDTSQLTQAINRLHSTTSELSHFCEQMDQRLFYLQKNLGTINLKDFITWQQNYWINNLFFKHYISMSTNIEDNAPSIIETHPILLTTIFEEAFKNAIEACYAIDSKAHFNIQITLLPLDQGLMIKITSPSSLDTRITPWEQGSSTKENSLGMGLALVDYFSGLAGWKWDLSEIDGLTSFTLAIPRLKTHVDYLQKHP